MYANSITLQKNPWRFFAVFLFFFAALVLFFDTSVSRAQDTSGDSSFAHCEQYVEACRISLGITTPDGEMTDAQMKDIANCIAVNYDSTCAWTDSPDEPPLPLQPGECYDNSDCSSDQMCLDIYGGRGKCGTPPRCDPSQEPAYPSPITETTDKSCQEIEEYCSWQVDCNNAERTRCIDGFNAKCRASEWPTGGCTVDCGITGGWCNEGTGQCEYPDPEPECRSDADCPDGDNWWCSGGYCMHGDPVAPGCSSDADCPGGWCDTRYGACMIDEDPPWPPGGCETMMCAEGSWCTYDESGRAVCKRDEGTWSPVPLGDVCDIAFHECGVELYGDGWANSNLSSQDFKRIEDCTARREPECVSRQDDECKRIMDICYGDPICWEKEARNVPGRLDCGGGDDWEDHDGREWEDGDEGFGDECPPSVVHACFARCEVSDVPNCVGKCVSNNVKEGQCSKGRPRGGEEEACRPFTRDDAKQKLHQMGGDIDPSEIEKMYKNMTLAWIVKVRREHGVDLTASDVESFPSCPRGSRGPGGPPGSREDFRPEFQRFERHGRGPDDFRGRGSEDVGRIFGEAVGMLVQLTQEDFLDANQRAIVTAALTWFGEHLVIIATADDIGPIVLQAKEKLREVMDLFEGEFGFDPGRFKSEMGRVREEIMGVINDAAMMLKMIPEAFRIMDEEFGYPISGWKPIYEGLDGILADARRICEKALDTEDVQLFEQCSDALHRFFEEEMERLMNFVEDSGVPEDVMDEVGRRMGFDDHDGRDDYYGPPGGDMNYMREYMEECLELGGDQEDCERRVMEKFGGQRGPVMMPGDYERPRGPMNFGPEGDLNSERMMRIMIYCMESGGSEQECKEELFEMFAPSSEDFQGGYERDYYEF